MLASDDLRILVRIRVHISIWMRECSAELKFGRVKGDRLLKTELAYEVNVGLLRFQVYRRFDNMI